MYFYATYLDTKLSAFFYQIDIPFSRFTERAHPGSDVDITTKNRSSAGRHPVEFA